MICNKCVVNQSSSFLYCTPCKRILDNDKYKKCISCDNKIEVTKQFIRCYQCNFKKVIVYNILIM